MTPDELFMQRALDLARLGMGAVSPNPQVGCVIVRDGNIIGEGWHRQYGGPHAEVNAVNTVADKSQLKNSTVYVTLEPCSHVGKTPPCADMLIAHQPKRVVVATLDSNPLVAGQGIKKLRQAGIEVVIGVLEVEAREINRRFFTFIEKKRPYIILKWAQTADGFIARKNFDSRWISNAHSRQWVHRWRSEEDAILIGRQTAAHDNPQLTVRDWEGRNPVRIILDPSLQLKSDLHVFDGSVPTLWLNAQRDKERPNLSLVKIDKNNFLANAMSELARRKIQSVIIEGGSATLRSFIEADLWDEARVFFSPKTFGEGIAAPEADGVLVEERTIEDDRLRIYRPRKK